MRWFLPSRRTSQRPPRRFSPARRGGHGEGNDGADEEGHPRGLGRVPWPALLAPDAVDLARDHARLDGCYARTLLLSAYPRHVALGWLDPLLAANETLDLSLHLRPQETLGVLRLLSRKMVQLQSSRLAGARTGRLADVEREVAYADCDDLRERLQRGEDRVLAAGLYVTVHAPTPEELEARTVRVETLIGTAMGQSRRATWQPLAGLRTTLPQATEALGGARLLDTRSLATLFPFSAGSLQMDGGVLLGRNTQNNALVIVNPFAPELHNANGCVLAMAGSGKSYHAKAELLRLLPLGVRIIVIDPEDEYVRLARAVNGQVIRLAAGARDRLNPLDLLPPADTPLSRLGGDEATADNPLYDHLATVHGFLDIALAGEGQRLDQQAKGVLDRALVACYAGRGITADPATHTLPAPTLPDLAATLREMGETQGLADRLERYCTGSLSGLFSGPTTVRLDGRLCVFALRDLEEELRPAAMYLVAQHVWGRARRDHRTPCRLIVDEAHVLTRHPSGDRFLETLARRGRKYFLGLLPITQDVRDFCETRAGKAILTNSAMRLLLRQDESTLDALEQNLRLTPAERAYLVTCPRGEGLLCVGSQRVTLRIEASPQEHALITTDPRELAALTA